VAKPTIAIVGPGALGCALAEALAGAGYEIREIVTRDNAASLRRARVLARAVGAQAAALPQARFDAQIIWLCVPDDAIVNVARTLSRRRDMAWRGKIVLHSSGALASDLLAPLRARGASCGSVHPMMTFVRSKAKGKRKKAKELEPMRGVWFGVEGDARAVRVGSAIARDLGGIVVPVKAANKALYHALGSFSSPMVIATLALAERIGREAGLSRRAVQALIRPILRRTIENYLTDGAAAAFSGPLRRGDVTTVRAHLRSLPRVPGAAEAYRALVRASLRTLPVGKRRQIEKLLWLSAQT
jgi:predicted short-subunit dehydrogenase-like oxidoreductase (DUF2520 family)